MHKASIKFGVSYVHEPEQRYEAHSKEDGLAGEIPPARHVRHITARGSVTRVGLTRRHGPRLSGIGADIRCADTAIAIGRTHDGSHARIVVGYDMPRGVCGGERRSSKGGCGE